MHDAATLPSVSVPEGLTITAPVRPGYEAVLTQDALEYRVVQREHLRAGDRIEGPAAVEEAGTTTLIDAGDFLSVEDHGCLVVDVGKA